MTAKHRFAITTAREGEPALVAELASYGLTATPTDRGAVLMTGSLEDGYRAALWSRVASRVLLPLGEGDASDGDALYDSLRGAPWDKHLGPDSTFAIEVLGTNRELRHPHFTALRAKDAIVDHFRDLTGRRPSIDRDRPDVKFFLRVREDTAVVSIDLSGGPLHQRGLGRDGGPAPARETLAAAMLIFADWPSLAARGVPLVDPFCGSGTILREAAGMALNRAPGLNRNHWGFTGWRGHQPEIWERLIDEARQAQRSELPSPIFGFDIDKSQVARSRRNLETYGLSHLVPVVRREFAKVEAPASDTQEPRGLLVTNPPYGERLGDEDEVVVLWRDIGDRLRAHWLGWTAWLLAGSKPLGGKIGLKPKRRIPMRNGALDGRLLHVPIATTPIARFSDPPGAK